jgi:predicted negative regulator of RcsB-dependent stress response
MAEDYLTDDEQWEALKRWVVENGLWVVAGIVLGVVALFGYRHVEGSRNDGALRAAAQFGEMTTAVERNDRNRSRQIADGIIKDFPKSPYADQAQLTIARLFVDEGQLPSAIAPLTQVMTNSKDTELRRIARLRLARVLTDQGKPDEAIKTLAEESPGAFAARFHAVRGDAFYAKKDFKSALTEYKAALNSGDASNVDAALLELKIADLGEPSAPATAMAPPVISPSPSNKAKP